MIIDAHQHFWSLARGDYGWLKPSATALFRDFLPGDLQTTLAAHGVAATVLVQAAPSEAETLYLLALARDWPTARAVVGWVDMTSDTAEPSLERLAEHPLLRGVRPMIQDEPNPEWMLQPAVGRSLRALKAHALTLDALVRPLHLPALKILVDRHPDVPVVIDHGAKPDIAGDSFQPWADDIRALSRRPQVMCKLSGLLAEAGPGASATDLRPYAEHLLDCFGPGRLMWGSDWPVLTQIGDYGAWLDQARTLVDALGDDEQAQIFGGAAAGFYRIGEKT